MGKPAVPLRYKLISLCAAGLLACGLVPAVSLADDLQDDSVAASFVLADSEGSGAAATPDSAASGNGAEGAILASSLVPNGASIVSADVALDAADPVVGSFTVDGLTYALNDGGVTLISVAGPLAGPEGQGSAEGGFTTISIPSAVTYNGTTYGIIAVGPYAFYLSGATSVELPASIASVDDRAFRSSDVERVEVAAGNPNLASFDGCLYDSQLLRLLLIPEGRKGSVLLSCETEVVQASLFSHCSLVEAISVEEGGAAFSSWEGLLYDASGTMLLRVPAGATDIAIRDGCTTIAAGALEGCAKLERINAPATVISISPDIFESVPTVALPATAVTQDDSVAGPLAGPGYEGDARSASADSSGAEGEAEVAPRRVVASSQGLEAPLALPDLGSTSASPSFEASGSVPQLTAMVALSSADDDTPEVDPASIEVILPDGMGESCWEAIGFRCAYEARGISSALAASATYAEIWGNGGVYQTTAQPGKVYEGSAACQSLYVGMSLAFSSTASSGVIKWGTTTGTFTNPGCSFICFSTQPSYPGGTNWTGGTRAFVECWTIWSVPITWDAAGGYWDGDASDKAARISTLASNTPAQGYDVTVVPERSGYRFIGWKSSEDGDVFAAGINVEVLRKVTYTAQWERVDCDLSFDTSSEPGDESYPSEAKPDQTVSSGQMEAGEQVAIEDPKRPGYVFEGWVIPNGDGTEAIDQELVYQGDDGKWYVDASKLPDYAGDDGRVELTARWTSVISVDVPSSVTFYADLVTQGQESREGVVDGAFGQSKVSNQSQVDLRVVGLESSAVKTEGSTLGADSILKKAEAATPSTSTQKLLSLYPSTKRWKPEDLQNPDAVGGSKATTAVDFDLDDILLEKSFKADDFTIAAGGTLNMGYRLNLSETGQQLDYDKLATLSEGQSASIANVSYTFAAEIHVCGAATGSKDDPLWIEHEGKVYGLKDIKGAAECISEHGTTSPCYPLYKCLFDKQVMQTTETEATGGTVTYGAGPYFQLQVDGVYLPLQLIGICQDAKSDGTGKAGLTFQMRDIYAFNNTRSTAAGGGTFDTYMNSDNVNTNGWGRPAHLRSALTSTFWGYLPASVQSAIAPVDKYQQLPGGTTDTYLQKTTEETVWLPSTYEVFGTTFSGYNESEGLTANGYTPFQYMAYQGNAGSTINTKAIKAYNGFASGSGQWLRSASLRRGTTDFCYLSWNGLRNDNGASTTGGAAPAFCL